MDEHEEMEVSSQASSSQQQRENDAGDLLSPDSVSPNPSIDDEYSTAQREGLEEVTPTGVSLPPEELPTLQWMDIDAELAEFELAEDDEDWVVDSPERTSPSGVQPAGFDDAMTWLEQLAAGRGMPIDEMPTLVTAPPGDENAKAGDEERKAVSSLILSARPVSELDSDPMAWLEQLAVDQSSPLEELPSVADRLLASEIVSQTEIPPGNTIHDPIEIGRALGYLEQLAMDQGVDLSAVSYAPIQADGSLDVALVLVDGLALAKLTTAAAAEAQQTAAEPGATKPTEEAVLSVRNQATTGNRERLVTGMPEDPQEALAWLGDFADDESGTETAVVEEADTMGSRLVDEGMKERTPLPPEQDLYAPVNDREESDADAVVLQEMPNDPDEAMAWMQNLARQVPGEADPEESVAAEPEEQSRSARVEVGESEALLEAQAALEKGDVSQALSLYRSVVDNDGANEELIAILEKVTGDHPDFPQFLRLLGDAYMQVGQVDRAVTAYRRGFDQL